MSGEAEKIRDTEALQARVLAGTTTRADVEWLVETIEVLDAELVRLRKEKGEAAEVLGLAGAGGSAAGLVPACYNLVSMYETVEAKLAHKTAVLAKIAAGDRHTAGWGGGRIARAALAGEKP